MKRRILECTIMLAFVISVVNVATGNTSVVYAKENIADRVKPTEVVNGHSRNEVKVRELQSVGFDKFKEEQLSKTRQRVDEIVRPAGVAAEFSVGADTREKPLLRIKNPDRTYTGKKVNLTDSELDLVYRIVQGEAGNQGYMGQALVAQCLRDTALKEQTTDIEWIRTHYKYSADIDNAPSDTVIKAVNFIFNGGSAVQHEIIWFYAPGVVDSTWHESQELIIEYKDHKFFTEVNR